MVITLSKVCWHFALVIWRLFPRSIYTTYTRTLLIIYRTNMWNCPTNFMLVLKNASESIWNIKLVLGGQCHSPRRMRMCRRSRTQADSGSPPVPSRERCPPTTCASCGSGTWMPRNHRSEGMTTELLSWLQTKSVGSMPHISIFLIKSTILIIFPLKSFFFFEVRYCSYCWDWKILIWVSNVLQSCHA